MSCSPQRCSANGSTINRHGHCSPRARLTEFLLRSPELYLCTLRAYSGATRNRCNEALEAHMSDPIRVTVWNEGIHEQTKAYASDIDSYYPDGIHGAIAAGIASRIPSAAVRTAVMSEPEHGLTQDVVDSTDVLLWWGHV